MIFRNLLHCIGKCVQSPIAHVDSIHNHTHFLLLFVRSKKVNILTRKTNKIKNIKKVLDIKNELFPKAATKSTEHGTEDTETGEQQFNEGVVVPNWP